MSKSLSDIDLVPGTVGFVVGATDRIVGQHIRTKHRQTFFRAAVVATGLVGQRVGWSDDINIGLMAAAATLAAQSVPGAIHDKNSSEAFPQVRPTHQPGTPLRPKGDMQHPSPTIPPVVPGYRQPVAQPAMGIPHRIIQNNGPQWRNGTMQPTTSA